jgi:hypothetical protein
VPPPPPPQAGSVTAARKRNAANLLRIKKPSLLIELGSKILSNYEAFLKAV